MTKQELQRLRHYDSDLRILRAHLKDLEASIGITSAPQDGQPKGNKIGRPTEEQAVRISQLLSEIRALEKLVTDKRMEAWDYISSLQDPLLRQIIILRFVDGKSWFKVADSIGKGMTEDGCRMYFNRAFQKTTD